RAEIRDGLHWLWHQPLIRIIALLASGNTIIVSGIVLIVIVLAKQQHASPTTIGLILAVGGIGGVLGALNANSLLKRLSFGQVIIGTSWIWTLLLPLYVVAPNALILGGLMAVSAAALSIYDVTQFSYRLALIPDELQGRVNSVFRLISFSGQPLGLALTGTLLETINTVPTVLVFSICLLFLAVVRTSSTHIRTARPIAEAQAVERK